MPRYKIEDVNIGDEIQYTHHTVNIPPDNWKVVAKLDKTILIIEREEAALNKRRMIEIQDVVKIFPSTRQS